MALPFKPKGSSPPAETKAMDAMAGEEIGEPAAGDDEPMTPGEIGSMLIRAVKAGDGEAVYEAILKCK